MSFIDDDVDMLYHLENEDDSYEIMNPLSSQHTGNRLFRQYLLRDRLGRVIDDNTTPQRRFRTRRLSQESIDEFSKIMERLHNIRPD